MRTRRLQIRIDESTYRRLRAEARERGTSVAAVIRDAIDQLLPAGASRRARAARAILSAEPMEVPDPAELRAEIEAAHSCG
ncbi:MAG: ribbon-helix-helix protein, CopG family [Gaiellales bacterium]